MVHLHLTQLESVSVTWRWYQLQQVVQEERDRNVSVTWIWHQVQVVQEVTVLLKGTP